MTSTTFSTFISGTIRLATSPRRCVHFKLALHSRICNLARTMYHCPSLLKAPSVPTPSPPLRSSPLLSIGDSITEVTNVAIDIHRNKRPSLRDGTHVDPCKPEAEKQPLHTMAGCAVLTTQARNVRVQSQPADCASIMPWTSVDHEGVESTFQQDEMHRYALLHTGSVQRRM